MVILCFFNTFDCVLLLPEHDLANMGRKMENEYEEKKQIEKYFWIFGDRIF
jgi:hypothetical protein